MTIPPSFTEESLFCMKYLLDHGWFEDQRAEIESITEHLETDFTLVEVKSSFFTELASKLRELWPPGEKDGKYPWRDSVSNLAKRLQFLWTMRDMKDYTIDQCLTAARRYLAQFEDNVKYMRILKYFILKQSSIVDSKGGQKLVNQSLLADMLESSPEEAFEPELVFKGELI